MTVRVWTNPGPFPCIFRWELTEGFGDVKFEYRCRNCRTLARELTWSWIGSEGPELQKVLNSLRREAAKVVERDCLTNPIPQIPPPQAALPLTEKEPHD